MSPECHSNAEQRQRTRPEHRVVRARRPRPTPSGEGRTGRPAAAPRGRGAGRAVSAPLREAGPLPGGEGRRRLATPSRGSVHPLPTGNGRRARGHGGIRKSPFAVPRDLAHPGGKLQDTHPDGESSWAKGLARRRRPPLALRRGQMCIHKDKSWGLRLNQEAKVVAAVCGTAF